MTLRSRFTLGLVALFLAVVGYGLLVAFEPILYTLLAVALVAVVLLVRWVVGRTT